MSKLKVRGTLAQSPLSTFIAETVVVVAVSFNYFYLHANLTVQKMITDDSNINKIIIMINTRERSVLTIAL
jgi:hypothetical protein